MSNNVSFNQAQLRRPYATISSYNQLKTLRNLNLKYISGKPVVLELGLNVKPITITIEEESSLNERIEKVVYFVGHSVTLTDGVREYFGFGPLQRLAFLAKTMNEESTSISDELLKNNFLDERSNLPLLINY